MADFIDIVKFLDEELDLSKFKNDRKNGIVLKGAYNVKKVGFSVNLTKSNIETAKKKSIDFLIVHHGGWRETDLDTYKEKINLLKKYNISLYIAHSSLDCSNKYGTSYSVAKKLDIKVIKRFAKYYGGHAGIIGIVKPVTFSSFLKNIKNVVNRKTVYHKNNGKKVKKIAIVVGGVADVSWIKEATDNNADTFVCGDAFLFAKLYCFEKKINLICAGHTATERFGFEKLGTDLVDNFKVKSCILNETFF